MPLKNTITIVDLLGPYARRAELAIQRLLIRDGVPEPLAEAMHYCTLGGGKRIRPAVVYMSAQAVGARDEELVDRAAAAVELVHCYSLVHDDLPMMDDDALRRGRPTAHVKFSEAMAILAGDALLTRAMGVLGEADDPRGGRLVAELAAEAGAAGMIAGQAADMDLCPAADGMERFRFINLRKTAALMRAAARMGAICGDANEEVLKAMDIYAGSIGLAFQVIDDILDVTGRAEVIGKTPGKDAVAGKETIVAQLGLTGARDLADELAAKAVEALAPLGDRATELAQLAALLGRRTH